MATKKGRSLSNVMWPSQGSGPLPRQVEKIGRNDRCPCGSGKKYKDCHESEGDAFLKRLARQAHKERIRGERQRLKEKGVPWYKRIFLQS